MIVQLAAAHHSGPSALFAGVFFVVGGFFCRYMGGKQAEAPFDPARMTTAQHEQMQHWARISVRASKFMIWGGAAMVALWGLTAI